MANYLHKNMEDIIMGKQPEKKQRMLSHRSVCDERIMDHIQYAKNVLDVGLCITYKSFV